MGEVVHSRPLTWRRRRTRLLAALSVLLLSAPAGAAVPKTERAALTAFYKATVGQRWKDRSGWQGAAGTECSWKGVQCDKLGNTVIGLDLSENGLTGKVPPGLTGLPNLQTLDLGLNQLSGPLPKQLGSLKKLRALALPFNKLSGSLPAELGSLPALQVLDLSLNQFSGALPAQLGSLGSLIYLDLSGNRFTGTIPLALGQLKKLQALYLDDNLLSGVIPAALGSLESLRQLGLGGNQLTGRIPAALGKLSNLMFLNLEKNHLGGPVPPELGNATALIGVLLSWNELAGTIPGTFLNPPELQALWLDHNRFTGPVPFELGAIPTLDDNGGLDLRFNSLATDTEPGLLADLNLKQVGGNWTRSQAVAAALDPQYPLTNLTDRRSGGMMVWTLQVAAGGSPLVISTAGGSGNADLYVRFGAAPTTSLFDASSAGINNSETVTIPAPKAGTWFVGLRAGSAYSGVTLRVGAR